MAVSSAVKILDTEGKLVENDSFELKKNICCTDFD